MNFNGNSPHSDLGLIPASAEETDVLAPHSRVELAPAEFERLRRVPPLLEWLANVENPNTRRAYRNDLLDFMQFVGLQDPQALPTVTRAHVIAWRRSMTARALKPASVRRKLSALSEFYHFLADLNLIATNPVDGVKRPAEGANEGKTPALSDAQAKALLSAPAAGTVKAAAIGPSSQSFSITRSGGVNSAP